MMIFLLKWITFPCRLDVKKSFHIFKKEKHLSEAMEAMVRIAGLVVRHQGVCGSGIQKAAPDAQKSRRPHFRNLPRREGYKLRSTRKLSLWQPLLAPTTLITIKVCRKKQSKPVVLPVMWSSVKQRLRIQLPLLTYSDHKVTFTNPKLTNKVTWS